jgi:hypothetical protein
MGDLEGKEELCGGVREELGGIDDWKSGVLREVKNIALSGADTNVAQDFEGIRQMGLAFGKGCGKGK